MEDRKVAVITGEGSGSGAACVRALAARGFWVGIHYRRRAEAARALLAEVGEGFLLSGDLTRSEDIDALIESIKTAAGRLDVLVHNAGFSLNGDIHAMRLEQFDAPRLLARGVW